MPSAARPDTDHDDPVIPWPQAGFVSPQKPVPGARAPQFCQSAAAIQGFITPRGRDLRIDILRGAMVMAMVVEHVDGIVPVRALATGNRFFMSAAEGFVLISGLIAGLAYRRPLENEGLSAVAKKLLARAAELYLLTVAMTLLLLPISEALQLPWAERIDLSRAVELVVSVLTLHRTYFLADVLLLFTLLFLVAPLALALLAARRTVLLMAISWSLWAAQQFFPAQLALPWSIEGNAMFGLAAWQALFITGMVLGYHTCRRPPLTRRTAWRWQVGLGVALVALIALNRVLLSPAGVPRLAALQEWTQLYLFGKALLAPGRVLTSLIVMAFLFLTLSLGWRWFGRPANWLLGRPGADSLYAFSAHVVVLVVAALALKDITAAGSAPPWANLLAQVVILVIVWLLVASQPLRPTPRRRRIWQATPAVLALAAILVLPRLPARPAPLAALAVSDAVLARARAFGTPIARLEAAGRTASAAAGPARARTTPRAGLAHSAPAATHTASPARAVGGRSSEPAPGPTPTVGPVGTPAAPARETGLATPATIDVPRQATTAAEPGRGPDARSGPRQGLALVAQARAAATPGATLQALKPLPPLPPDSRLVRNQFVHVEAGRAYSMTFRSELLQREMTYWIYLPPGYGKTDQRYPALYMLHGSVGLIEEWPAYGLVDTADRAFAAGVLPPFIIVLPQGDTSFWANWADNDPRWGDYLAYEVVGQVDAGFGTLRSPAARAIGGLSMGAWGALHHGFVHPDIFGVVLASSPTTYKDHDFLWFLGSGAEYASKDPRTLARISAGAAALRIWIDVGDNDPWVPAAAEIHNILSGRGINHAWHLYPGEHGGEYWATHVPDYLTWIAANLAGAGP